MLKDGIEGLRIRMIDIGVKCFFAGFFSCLLLLTLIYFGTERLAQHHTDLKYDSLIKDQIKKEVNVDD
jgi:hypothetical protein